MSKNVGNDDPKCFRAIPINDRPRQGTIILFRFCFPFMNIFIYVQLRLTSLSLIRLFKQTAHRRHAVRSCYPTIQTPRRKSWLADPDQFIKEIAPSVWCDQAVKNKEQQKGDERRQYQLHLSYLSPWQEYHTGRNTYVHERNRKSRKNRNFKI